MRTVAVVGGGMGGLATALWLSRRGFDVLVLERDPAPPDLAPEQAFGRWKRSGVPQFRHAHILLGRLHTTLRDEHPELLQALLSAGIERSALTEVLPETQVEGYTPLPGDEDLLHLWGRRPTFEYVVRRYVGGLANVRFVHDARVTGLVSRVHGSTVVVEGVEYEQAGVRRRVDADVVVDASGKRSPCPSWLSALGVGVDSEVHRSDRSYVCRHYRLKDPHAPRPRVGTGANLDYVAFAVFYAEHGHFAITLSCLTEERDLVRAMNRAEGFERLCAAMPPLRQWLDKSQPTSKVLGGGDFENRWTRVGSGRGRKVTGYFPVGDVHVETNPVYGRGCTSAFLQARALAQVLASEEDPARQSQRYYRETRRLLRTHFDFCVSSDMMFSSRARRGRGKALPVAERTLHWVFDRVWGPALEQSPVCAREMVRAMQMREVSPLSVRLTMLAHIFYYGVGALLRPRPALPSHGPDREQTLRLLCAPDERGADRSCENSASPREAEIAEPAAQRAVQDDGADPDQAQQRESASREVGA